MIFARPLKKILGKIVPFGQFETIHPSNLGTGEADGTKFLNGNGEWASSSDIDPLDNITTISATYTILSTDRTVICNSNTFTVTLPTAVGVEGKRYTVTNIGSGIITLDGNGSETIQGDLTQFIYTDETLDVVSNGTNWFVI